MAYFCEAMYILDHLDPSYNQFIHKLKEIIKITDQLFVTQIHPQYGVYPEGFAQWLKKHTEYKTQPFTVVRFDGKIVREINYHIFYQRTVVKISQLLEDTQKTIDVITDATFDKVWWHEYIVVLKDAFNNDHWEKAEAYFLSVSEESPLLLSIGPIDPYHDTLLGTKRYFSAWLLVRNVKRQTATLPLWRTLIELTNKQNKTFDAAPTKLYLGDLLLSGGEVAKHNAMGWSRPENAATAKSIGSVKSIALNKLPAHTEKMAKSMHMLLDKSNLSPKTIHELMEFHNNHSLLPLLLHEFGHTFDKIENAQIQLGEYYQLIEETRANTNMLSLAILLEQKGEIADNTARNIFLRVIFYSEYLYQEYNTKQQRVEYLFAGLLWLQKAEARKIIAIENKKLLISEENLALFFDAMVKEIVKMIYDVTYAKNNKVIIAKLKIELLSYGEEIAKKLFNS